MACQPERNGIESGGGSLWNMKDTYFGKPVAALREVLRLDAIVSSIVSYCGFSGGCGQ